MEEEPRTFAEKIAFLARLGQWKLWESAGAAEQVALLERMWRMPNADGR